MKNSNELDKHTLTSLHDTQHAHPQRLRYLDGWRGLSIIGVLFGHYFGSESGLFTAIAGVEMFFALSGRLMAQILFIEGFPLGEFYRRRAARIIPALMTFLVIGCILFRTDTYLGPKKIKAAIASLFMIYNYFAAGNHHARIFDHTWSLCVEEHSYLILAIVAYLSRLYNATPKNILLLGILLSMLDGLISSTFLHEGGAAYWRTDAHIASALLGAWSYLTFRNKAYPKWTSPLCFLGGMLCFSSILPIQLYYTIGTTLLCVSVATIDRSFKWYLRILSNRSLGFVGTLSFSLYLWQQPFFQMARWEWGLPPVLVALYLISAIACGLASYFLVEKPARRWINSLRLNSQ